MRRGSIVALLLIGLAAAGVATVFAIVPTWLPVAASVEAGRIDSVFWFLIEICVALFAVVAAAIIYCVARFRAAPDDLEDGPSIHGHTGLEITWTAIPFVLITAIAIVSGIALAQNDAQGAGTTHINVQAQQFAFTFGYPDAGNATSPVLRLRLNTSTELDMRSADVIHAFFVAEFRENMDIVPGLITHIHVTPNRLGTYSLICNELCGLGHALMRTEAIVMPQKAYDAWIAQQKAQQPQTAGSTG